MNIPDMLRQRTGGVSFELLPPPLPAGGEGLQDVVAPLRRQGPFDPLFVAVTSRAGQNAWDRTRSSLAWLAAQTDLTVMPHLTCLGATKSFIDKVLQDLSALGIDNILVLRGDAPPAASEDAHAAGDFRHAKDLVAFIKTSYRFSVAVGVYPEGHPEAPSIEKDMEYTRQKVDAGADFALTQMFFDNRCYYRFRERAAKWGITIPVVPGIMPVTDYHKTMQFSAYSKVTVPRHIQDELAPFSGNPVEMRRRGIEQTVRQCEDLLGNGVSFLHFFTLNRAEAVSGIIDALAASFPQGSGAE